ARRRVAPPMSCRGRAARPKSSALLDPRALQYDFHRLENYKDIDPVRDILDVEKVVFELAVGIVDREHVALVHLGPASDPGPHDMAIAVERDFLFIPFGQADRFRAGA